MIKTIPPWACLLIPLLGVAAEEPTCSALADCNRLGSEAYKQGRHDAAAVLFERQLSLAEMASDAQAREQALNNLAINQLRLGNAPMARAWLNVALDAGMSGPATRHNLAPMAEQLDYPRLASTLEGRYARYAGQGAWSRLTIERAEGGGHRALFSPLRVGKDVQTYGPVAIGELSGRLTGQGVYWRLTDAGLAQGCAVELLHEGADVRVLEVLDPACQAYGGAGISVGGRYYKLATQGGD